MVTSDTSARFAPCAPIAAPVRTVALTREHGGKLSLATQARVGALSPVDADE